MKLNTTIFAIAMAFAASSAHASFTSADDGFIDDSRITALTASADVDGTLSFDYVGFVPQNFEQFFSFTLPNQEFDVSAHASNYTLSSKKGILLKDITSIEFEVYDASGAIIFDTTASSPVGTIGTDFVATLGAGTYYVEVEGSAIPAGGKIGINVLASPSAVPEPSAWAMMVAGLGILGYMSIRRRNYF